MAEKAEKTDFAYLVYTGEYDGAKVKTVHGYLEIDPKTQYVKNFNHEIYMTKALRGSRNPGVIFRLEISERDETGNITSWYPNTAEVRGFIQNKEIKQTFLIEWQTRTRARREERINIKEASKNIIQENLETIRWEYRKLSPAKRRAFLAYILEYMNR